MWFSRSLSGRVSSFSPWLSAVEDRHPSKRGPATAHDRAGLNGWRRRMRFFGETGTGVNAAVDMDDCTSIMLCRFLGADIQPTCGTCRHSAGAAISRKAQGPSRTQLAPPEGVASTSATNRRHPARIRGAPPGQGRRYTSTRCARVRGRAGGSLPQQHLDNARNPRDGVQIPAWTDRRSRPLGAIVNLDRYQPDAAERAAALRDQIERLSDVLHRTRTTLGEMRARIATTEAAGHAAEVTGEEPSGDVNALTVTYQRLSEQLEERDDQYRELLKLHGELSRMVERVSDERSLRESLTDEELRRETEARLEHLREASTARTASRGLGAGPSL